MTEFLISAGPTLSVQTSTINTIVQEIVTPAVSEEATPNACIVCSKPAKPSSIYCSDDCIRKHAGSVPMVKPDKAKDRRPSVAPSTSATPTEPIPSSPNPSTETVKHQSVTLSMWPLIYVPVYFSPQSVDYRHGTNDWSLFSWQVRSNGRQYQAVATRASDVRSSTTWFTTSRHHPQKASCCPSYAAG